MEILRFIKWWWNRLLPADRKFASLFLFEILVLIITIYADMSPWAIPATMFLSGLLFAMFATIYAKIRVQWRCYLREQQLIVDKLAGR